MTDTATDTGSTFVRRVDPIVAVVIDESESTDRTAATAAVAIRAAQHAVGSERVLVVGHDATEAWAQSESVRWIASDGTPLGGLERAVLAADGAPLLYCSGNSAAIAAGLDALVASLAPDAMTVSGAERDVDGEPVSTPTLFDWVPRPGTLIATEVVAADTERAGLVAALRHAARSGRPNLHIDAVTVARIGDTSAGAHVRTDAWTAAAIVRSVRSSFGHRRAGRARDLAAAVTDAARALRGLAVLAAIFFASAAILASGAGGPSAWIMPAVGMVIVATGALALLERQRPGGAVSELVRSIDVSALAIAAIVRRGRRHRSRPVRNGGLALLARPVTTAATIALESAISYASVRLATADRADPVGTRATVAAIAAGVVLLAPMLVSLGVVVRVRPRRASSRAELAFSAAVDGRPTRVVDVSIGGLAVSASSPITVGHRVGVLLDPEDGALPMTVVRCSPHGHRHVIGLRLDPDAPPAARAALERTWLDATQRIVTATAVRPARVDSPSGTRTPAGGRATWTIGGSVAVRVATAVTLIALGAAVLPPYPASFAAGAVVVNSTLNGADNAPGDGSCDSGLLNSAGQPECTLRAAIQEANASATVDTIEFAIPTTDPGYSAGRGVFTIAPTSDLPTLATTITIDGATQAVNVGDTNPGSLGYVGPVGTGPDGVLGTGDEPTLDGVAAPEIELDYNGQLGLVAAADDVSISGLAVFGANPDVMIAGGTGVVIEDMVIGTRADSFTDPGAGSRSTGSGGVAVFAGSGAQVRDNLIGYQTNRGIEVSGTMSALTIAGNEITGTSQGTTVEGGGIEIVNYWNSGGAITGLLVTGNLIHDLVDDHGIEVATDVADSGVVIDDNTIIGTSPLIVYGNQTVDGGTITHNVLRDSIGHGIYVDGVADWTISENSITNSTWEGIGLSGTANDGITAPSITQATAGVGTVTADYSITAPPGAYQVELFDNTVAGTGGVGEGETYLGTDPIIHPGGTATYRHTVNGGLGDIITATLTADLGSGDLGSTSAFSNAFTVTEFLEPVVLDRIQKGVATIANGSSSTSVNISAVDPSRSFLTYSIRGNASTPNDMQVRGELTDADTVTFSRYGTTTAIAIEWSVVEFESGVTVQRGTTSLSTTTTDLAISSVDLSRSFPIVNVSVGGGGFGADDFVRAELTSSTNLRLHVRAVNLTNAVSWQVVTYNQAAVQSGTVAFGSAVSSVTATTTAVDPSTAWLVYSVDSAAGTTANIGQKLVRGVVTNPTTLTFDRSSTGQAMNVTWYLVEFTDDTLVQSGSSAFGTGTTQNDVSITTVDPTRSVATGGHLGFGGRSSYTADDNPGVGWFTTRFTSATNVRATRGVTGTATADLGWFVITWSGAGSRTVTVNATDDDADLFPGDGYCDTGGVNASGLTECTLRAAIQEANASAVIDTIHFDIPTSDAGHSAGVWTISLLGSSALRVWAPTTIDATTQPGYVAPSTTFPDPIDGPPVVRIDRGAGSTIQDAIWLDPDADGSLVRGLSITGFNGANASAVAVESAGVTVVGNWLGIAPDGSIDANQTGVDIGWGATDTVVGGPSPADRNRIVGNSYAAVAVFDSTTTGTVIKGNEISQNGLFGVVLWSGTSGNEIGGVGAGDGNIIESNDTGILVDANASASFAVILGNRIVGNAGVGIDLLYDGVTPNDPGDVDTGPNDLLNFPVISSAGSAGATVDVSYSLDVPAGNYRVEFFANPSGADGTGYGEGETFVHAETISHAGLGTAGFTASFAGSAGDVITATATEHLGGGSFGSTSEFSAAVTVASSIVVVNSTGDDVDQNVGDGVCQTSTPGECTLRAAIQEADASAGIDTIHFAIPGPGPTWTITPGSALPTVTDTVTIDATTQTGWVTTPVVVLDGVSSAGAVGLTIGGADTVVRGFAIGRFVRGLDVLGSAARAVIADNHIGVDAAGTAAFANDAQGLTTGADDVVISGNVVAGNGADGIIVSGAARTRIVDNLIGTDVTGNVALPNGQEGIEIMGTTDVVIGEPGAGNVISGNRYAGINGWSLGSTGVVIQSNLIGVGADGTTALGNGATVTEGGITLRATNSGWLIGGTGTGEGNVIANNVGDGVQLSTDIGTSTDIAVIGNEVFANTGLGIDHGDDDVSPDDTSDVDTGSNDLLNFPVISSVAVSGAAVDVSYSLDVPAGDYRIEFFANPSGADPTGYGEGETFVHAETVSHAGLGSVGFTATLPATVGYITATTTEDLGGGSFGSTSEFSAAVCIDSDSDGLCFEDWNRDGDADPATDPGPDTDGDTTPNYLDPDDDGDGIPTADENGDPNGNGDPRDARDTDRDGQPDYLDIEAGPSSVPIADEQKISATSGGLIGPLDDGDELGQDVTGIGDLDGDGINDLVVGVPLDDDGGTSRGAVYVLFLNADGTVRAEQKISDTAGGFTGVLDDFDEFGHGIATIGDVDGDGVTDIAVGTWNDGDSGPGRGAVWVLFLERDGTVKAHRKISDTTGGLVAALDDYDRFGSSLTGVGDLDGDGTPDLAVGARWDDDGGTDRGAVHVLFLNRDGSVRGEQKISDTVGGLAGVLDDLDEFGHDVDGIGDVDGDGIGDLAVGAPRDDDGGTDRGAVHVLFLNADGTVRAEQKLSAAAGPLAAALDDHDWFGSALAGIGGLDGNGTPDLAVGARGDTDGAWNAGAVHLLRLAADGTIVGGDKISATTGGLAGPLDVFDHFGRGVSSLGDLDGDGTLNLAVSARYDDDGGTDRGAVYILDLSLGPCAVDTDGDGLWDCEEDWNRDGDADPATDPGPDTDGDVIPNYLDADDDGDGIPTVDENADPNADRDPRDALDSDRDGQPDWLDAPTVPTGSTVADEQKISDLTGGLTATLDDSDTFGRSVASIGDVDGDGIVDVAVGANLDDDGAASAGAVHILFMNTDGTVRDEQKISALEGGLTGPLVAGDQFGISVAGIGDLDGDGTPDIAIGSALNDDGGFNRGSVYILMLNPDGTVKAEQKISSTQGGLTGPLDNSDQFGLAASGIGDLDGDGTPDLAVGAYLDDDGGPNRGSVYVLFLNADGTVRAEQKISDLTGGLTATLDDNDEFGRTVATVGDVDGDGTPDLAVGAVRDDDGGTDRGAVHILFLEADGNVRAEQKISDLIGGLTTTLDDNDQFGFGLGAVGDLDDDGIPDLAVGAHLDDDGGGNQGAIYILALNADGTVDTDHKISETTGGLTGPLDSNDSFGRALSGIGDLDGDGTIGLIVAAHNDDDGGADRGAVYILDLERGPMVVNSTADIADANAGDGRCRTGATNSEGLPECTLRAAIEEANALGGGAITFGIPTSDPNHSAGTWTITPAAGNRLPPILVPVTIDGTTQPGTTVNTAQAPDPMNGRLAIQLSGASDSVTDDWDGLVLGTGSNGSEIRGISFTGWDNEASDAVIAWGSSDNVIAGNYFGVRADGTAAGDGVNAGVGIGGGSAGNRIGGTAPADRNLFSNDTASGNAWTGVWVTGSTITATVVRGNEFGFGIGGLPSPGGYAGVHVFGGATVVVGGVDPGAANRITGRMSAVVVQGSTTASMLGNRIWGNSGIGVDLAADGVTFNDAGDVDTGANDLLNFPVITSASTSNGRVDVTYNLDVPAGNYRVEFFTNPSGADPTGYGEGETFVHAVAISHAGGVQTFTTRFAGAPGDVVTATITEDLGAGAYGSTSEFSRAYTASVGVTVLDRSGRRTDLRSAGGTPASGPGAAGTGITFDGDDERLVGPATDLTSGAITLSAWVRLDATATAPRVISKRAAGGAIYELSIDDATGEAVAKFDIGGVQISVQGGALAIGTWHQVAATWDGTTVRLYVDGGEVAQAAASGALATDLAAPLVVGNAADASGGLVGSVDVVELAHTARSAAWIETAYLNVSDPARFVSVGEVQLAAPGTWAASSAVVRSGSGALAAPAATADAEAWTTVTGLDEPGLAFESWWYVTAPATSNIAGGTNTGRSPVEQRELGSSGGSVDLATRSVGGRTVDAGSGASLSPSTWTRVEIRTDELGRSSAWIDGVQVIGPTVHSGGTSAGSAGLRAGTLGAGGWYVDDVRIRRYVSDEPTTTLGPLHRN